MLVYGDGANVGAGIGDGDGAGVGNGVDVGTGARVDSSARDDVDAVASVRGGVRASKPYGLAGVIGGGEGANVYGGVGMGDGVIFHGGVGACVDVFESVFLVEFDARLSVLNLVTMALV